jgi:phosphohistidine phosphatase
VEYLDTLYLAEPTEILEVLRLMPDEYERLMVIGHNPGLEGLVQMLSRSVESMPTASIAHLYLPVEHWKDMRTDAIGELVEVLSPRTIKPKETKEKKKKKK